ncbi:MAG: HAD-IA family hydrolase [Lachnospiraceae bacterium]|nr:HAD-IA family hydrolase [Lachnospiraceae bacterium]
MIKNIIFDVGNVLIDFCWKKLMISLGFSDEIIKALGSRMVCSPYWNELDLNEKDEHEVVETFKKEIPEYAKEIDEFFGHMEGLVEVYPGSAPWIKSLKDRGFNVYLLSNYPERAWKIHEKGQFDFIEYVDGAVVSYEYKLTKPDRRIYQTLLDKYSLDPSECIFLDDKPENVEAARNLGIKSILVRNQEQAKLDLDDTLSIMLTKLGQKSLYKSNVIELCHEDIELPNGRRVTYDLVKQKGGASVLPIDDEGNVILIMQYRNAIDRVNLEIPGGGFDHPGEDPLVCAKRELEEEMGIVAKSYERYTRIVTDIGICTDNVTIYFATGLKEGTKNPDPEEFIRIRRYPLNEAIRLIELGEIVDAKTVTAILGYARNIGFDE